MKVLIHLSDNTYTSKLKNFALKFMNSVSLGPAPAGLYAVYSRQAIELLMQPVIAETNKSAVSVTKL
jgi:hypothetical protein